LILPGTWGWTIANGFGCDENPHDIEFSADRKSMFYSVQDPVESPTGEIVKTIQYHILDTSPHLRMRIEGETRTTPAGDPVVWDLILISPDRYCWHRTDWPVGACTANIERCQ
jgi:hypothetical protein